MNVIETVTLIKNPNAKFIFLAIAERQPIAWKELLEIKKFSEATLRRNIKNLLDSGYICISKTKQYYVSPEYGELASDSESHFPHAKQYQSLCSE